MRVTTKTNAGVNTAQPNRSLGLVYDAGSLESTVLKVQFPIAESRRSAGQLTCLSQIQGRLNDACDWLFCVIICIWTIDLVSIRIAPFRYHALFSGLYFVAPPQISLLDDVEITSTNLKSAFLPWLIKLEALLCLLPVREAEAYDWRSPNAVTGSSHLRQYHSNRSSA